MRVWRKKQKWQVIAALLFAVWILMGTRKINVNAENMEAESFTGETAVETEEETKEKTVTAGIGYRASLSQRFGNPLIPPSFRRFLNPSFLPVRILWVYA